MFILGQFIVHFHKWGSSSLSVSPHICRICGLYRLCLRNCSLVNSFFVLQLHKGLVLYDVLHLKPLIWERGIICFLFCMVVNFLNYKVWSIRQYALYVSELFLCYRSLILARNICGQKQLVFWTQIKKKGTYLWVFFDNN